MTEPAGVICVGNITVDILARPVDDITWGGTKWIDSIEQSLGGNGANTSATLAKLGVPVTLIGGAGRDAFGDFALKRLQECGVATHLIQRVDTPTAASVALVKSDGTRAFLHRPGVSRELFRERFSLTETVATGSTRLHVGNPFGMTHLRTFAPGLLAAAQGLGLETSMDTAWDAMGEWMKVVGPCLPHAGILFTNEDEARMLTGTANPAIAAQRLRAQGATVVVLKLGQRGCAVFGPGVEAYIPGYDVPVIDTTGAGDCFAGAFLASLQRGLSCPQAAAIANAVGALNVQSLGATSGLVPWADVLAWIPSARLRT